MSYDVATPSTKRGPQNAVAVARQRLAEVRTAVGERHPDYASALIQLALLLIMHGDPAEAEPLLRQALDVRKETLGDRHPDYATCLSSLAGLLWARGDLNGAEPLLQQALEIRREVLGEHHPKSIVSLNSLDQLLQAKNAWTAENGAPLVAGPAGEAAQPVSEPADVQDFATILPFTPPAPVRPTPDGAAVTEARADSNAGQPSGPTRAELAGAIESLAGEFVRLGGALNATINPLRVDGVVPSEQIADQLDAARQRFATLRDGILALASGLGMPGIEAHPTTSLKDLTALLAAVERFEAEGSRIGLARKHALEVLGRVSGLAYSDTKEFPPLRDCQRKAQELARAIEGSRQSNLLPDAFTLAGGDHPYNALLALAGADGGLSDEQWAHALETVETHFGKPLSVAAARAKIVAGGASRASVH